MRELLSNGYVRERITQEHIQLIRHLTGEAVNLNQLARKANTFGFHDIAGECEELAVDIGKIIRRIKYDG